MAWEANASFQMGLWPRRLDLCWCQSLTKNEKILHLGESLVAIRESIGNEKIENKLLILLMSFFFKLSVLLSFKSHPPHPVSQEVRFWFLLSPHYQVFHSLRSVSLPSPHCSTLSREV